MAVTGFVTRMFTLGTDGRDPFIVNSSGYVSHFVWADAKHLAVFIRVDGRDWRIYSAEDGTGALTPIAHDGIQQNGHNTFIPGTANRWILCDTYPQGGERMQSLFLYDTLRSRYVSLGRFHSPPEFTAEWRVDLHARTSPNAKRIIFDSAHTGERQMWMLDMSEFDYG